MEHVLSIKITPNNFLFASVIGKGIYCSADSGSTWRNISPFLADEWNIETTASNELLASQADSGIYFSNDNGNSWNHVSDELPQSSILTANSAGYFFAESGGELFRSTDKGNEWWSLRTFGGTIVFDKTGTMFSAKGEKILSSSNNGTTWNTVDTTLRDIYSLMVMKNGAIIAGTFYDSTHSTASLYLKKSVDSAWIATGPASTVNMLVRDSLNGVYAATQDKGIYKSTDGGMTWSALNKGLTTSKVYSLVVDHAGFVYAGTADGIFRSSVAFPALPIELVSFSATVCGKNILLSWSTVTETNNSGFVIQRSEQAINQWKKIGFVEGSGTSNVQHEYFFSDVAVHSGKYFYRLKQIDRDGSFTYSEPIGITTSSVSEDYFLSQNYPNPFNPKTTLQFVAKSNGHASIKVYSVLGKEVSVLFDGTTSADTHHTITFDGSSVPSGIYFSVLRAGNKTEVRQMILLK